MGGGRLQAGCSLSFPWQGRPPVPALCRKVSKSCCHLHLIRMPSIIGRCYTYKLHWSWRRWREGHCRHTKMVQVREDGWTSPQNIAEEGGKAPSPPPGRQGKKLRGAGSAARRCCCPASLPFPLPPAPSQMPGMAKIRGVPVSSTHSHLHSTTPPPLLKIIHPSATERREEERTKAKSKGRVVVGRG